MEKLPNILSTMRMILAPVFLVMYLQDELVWRSLSIAVFAVAAITDFFDGYLARYYEVESDFGVFIDPLADKFLTFCGFFCLPFISPSQFPWWAVIVIVFRDIVITILRLYSNRKNIVMETRVTAKWKTAIQMVFLYIALLMGVFHLADVNISRMVVQLFETDVMYWFMMIVVAITLYSGFEYLYLNRSLFGSQTGEESLK